MNFKKKYILATKRVSFLDFLSYNKWNYGNSEMNLEHITASIVVMK